MHDHDIDRRVFLKGLTALGVLGAASAGMEITGRRSLAEEVEFPPQTSEMPAEAEIDTSTGEVTVNKDVIVRYSSCLGCYSSCGNRLKIDRASGRLLTVGGNPYHPNCAYPYLDFTEPLTEAYLSMSFANGKGNTTRGTLCGRGQGTQDAYSQPDRIKTPLKRSGKRGSGKWKPISWDQLISEVTEGGKLFGELGEDTVIEGFKSLHDTTTPLNADRPGLGPMSNQYVGLGGRGDGRAGFAARFSSAFGSLNNYSHGST